MNQCQNMHNLTAFQGAQFNAHLEKHKYYESERAGFNVGKLAAQMSFIERELPRLADEWRREFCGQCPFFAGCELGKEMTK